MSTAVSLSVTDFVCLPGKGIEVREFQTLCAHYIGPTADYICQISSLLAVMGAALVYWILMSNFLYQTLQYLIGKKSINTHSTLAINPSTFT